MLKIYQFRQRLTKLFAFFWLEVTDVRLRAKFEVSSFNRSRDIRGVPKFQNWVT